MKAAILRTVGQPMTVEDVCLDGPRENEVRVRILASGLCHSDYHLLSGHLLVPLPAILGHEVAGILEAVGESVPGLRVGDHVVTCFSSYCGECGECQEGYNFRCIDKPKGEARAAGSRIVVAGKPVYQLADLGGFAEETVVHHRSVVKVEPALPPAAAALLGCGVLTGVGAALNRARVAPGSKVAVIGCGGVGLNVVQGARIAGAEQIIAIDVNPDKLEMARTFGATHVVAAGEGAPGEVLELTGGGVHHAFDVVGMPATIRQGFSMLRMHGSVVIVGMPKAGSEMVIPILDLMYKDARIITSGMGDAPFQTFIPKLASLYMSGKLKLDELVSNRIRLDQINEGFDTMVTGSVARSVIMF